MQGQFRSVTQEHVLVNEAPKYLEKGRSANERLRPDEKKRELLWTLTVLCSGTRKFVYDKRRRLMNQTFIGLTRNWNVNGPKYKWNGVYWLDLQQQAHRLRNFFPEALSVTSVPSCKSSPSTCSTVHTDAHIPAPGSYPSTPRTSDLPSFMQRTEIVTESAAPGVPPSFLVQESAHQPFMPLGAPQSQPYRGPVQFSVSEEYYRASGGGGHGYSPGPPESCGSGGGGSGGSSGGGSEHPSGEAHIPIERAPDNGSECNTSPSGNTPRGGGLLFCISRRSLRLISFHHPGLRKSAFFPKWETWPF
ncbi:hypothetical protein H257_14848 [Aphanomyces astaci]|uniref:Uncharacterized protein n=1 Tax=Aphanomyces astaci TaxID=112090 RepID=W4FS60_APHAT|nr:hypothetical protein H257_14848 [Aphanomyces astaci]ETV69478.1 hypothetical protein H257_14848 [Aphanomyces astaci]|eukprot:XP_009841051.1 hypothetical protein H257_14848 [Aphanomyces astaci]